MSQEKTQQTLPDVLILQEGLPFDEVEQRIGVAYAAARRGTCLPQARRCRSFP